MPKSSANRDIVRLSAIALIAIAAGSALWWLPQHFDGAAAPRSSSTEQVATRPSGEQPTGEQPAGAAAAASPIGSIIRVNLTPDAVTTLRMAVDGPFRIRLIEPAGETIPADRLPETDVRATADGILVGRRLLRVDSLEILPFESPAVWINGHQYRGAVRLHRLAKTQLIAVNLLPLHAYLASVVDSEMPAAFPRAAREAQAIVARTYALYQMAAAADHPHFDLYSTTRSQNYLGYQYRAAGGRRLAGESAASRSIVQATAAQVLTLGGQLIPAYYSAVCGGETTSGAAVFRDAAQLSGVPCRWCREAALYRWSTGVDRVAASRALSRYFERHGKSFGTLQSFTISSTGNETAAEHFEVGDGVRRLQVAAATLRRDVFPAQLYSPRFTAQLTDDRLLFAGRGSGHGVGLCQWGARGMALSRRTAVEIVRHYYPGSSVSTLSSNRTAHAEDAAAQASVGEHPRNFKLLLTR